MKKKSRLVNLFVGCATHSISKRCFEGNLNAYWAYTMACGRKAMDKSVYYSSDTGPVQIRPPWNHVKQGWPGWKIRTKNLELKCTRQSAPPPTALLLAPLYPHSTWLSRNGIDMPFSSAHTSIDVDQEQHLTFHKSIQDSCVYQLRHQWHHLEHAYMGSTSPAHLVTCCHLNVKLQQLW